LNFHKVITQSDCIIAICIYQESLKFGNSQTNLSNTNLDLQHIAKDAKNNITDEINLFRQHLIYLCDTYVPSNENVSFDF
jgi:hypothetical protein